MPAANASASETHVVCPPAATAIPRNELCIFWVGSFATPVASGSDFYAHAAHIGFHVLSIAYPNTPTVAEACANKTAACFLSERNERLYNPTVGGMPRFATLLLELAELHPYQGWAQFWAGAGGTLDDVAWDKVVAAGHSQGAGMAVLVSKRYSLAGVVQLAGVDDVVPRASPSAPPSVRLSGAQPIPPDVLPAPWIGDPGATPANRLYGLGNARGFCCNAWTSTWAALNMTGWVDVEAGLPKAGGDGHQLCSHVDDGLGGHIAVLNDPATYRPSWAYMLTRGTRGLLSSERARQQLTKCNCTPDAPIADALKAHIHDYAALGPTHLTGTRDGERTAAWVREQLDGITGLVVEWQEVAVASRPWVPVAGETGCQLALDKTQVPCYAVHRLPDSAPTELREVPMERVAVIRGMPAASYELNASDLPVPADALAILVINAAGRGLTTAANVTQPRPYDWVGASGLPQLPVVTISFGWDTLIGRARTLSWLRLEYAPIANSTVHNVLATTTAEYPLGCAGPPRPLYIGTPIHGFFRCAGERGSGIALTLALAARAPPQCTATSVPRPCHRPMFGFTVGHEMGDPGVVDGVLPWLQAQGNVSGMPFVSIGANLGTFLSFEGPNFEGRGHGTTPTLLATSVTASPLTSALTRTLGSLPWLMVAPGHLNASSAKGASRWPLQLGMEVVNLLGGFPFPAAGGFLRFHLPADADESSVNLDSITALTHAVGRALDAYICAEPGDGGIEAHADGL